MYIIGSSSARLMAVDITSRCTVYSTLGIRCMYMEVPTWSTQQPSSESPVELGRLWPTEYLRIVGHSLHGGELREGESNCGKGKVTAGTSKTKEKTEMEKRRQDIQLHSDRAHIGPES